MSRDAAQVVERLLTSMTLMVQSYHPDVRRTGATLSELIPGTAFFPGGAGLWRGSQPFGPMPEFFPDHPVMFVGHNFDSARAYAVWKERGGEAQSPFLEKPPCLSVARRPGTGGVLLLKRPDGTEAGKSDGIDAVDACLPGRVLSVPARAGSNRRALAGRGAGREGVHVRQEAGAAGSVSSAAPPVGSRVEAPRREADLHRAPRRLAKGR
jgi:hypothetical protein